MAIIAISRQMGSGGYTIAAAVAKALQYEYADRQMIMNAARAYDVPEAAIAQVAERRLSGWRRFDEEKLRYRTFLEAAYFALAEKDNLVTAGRGIGALVRDLSHAVRIRIIAPFEVRVQRTMRKEGLDHAHAASKVRSYDREIAARIAYLFGPEWDIPENYDLVLNTVRDDPKLYIDIVVAVAQHPRFQPTPESLQRVRDLSLAAQVRAALAKDPETRRLSLEITADKGHVSVRGEVCELPLRDHAVRVTSAVPGVVSASAEDVTIAPYTQAAV